MDRLLHRRPGSDVDVAVLVDDKAVRHGEAVRHDLADRGLGTPEANRDSFTLLERAEEIDHSISYRAQTTELGDLEAFARWAAGKLD
ncbi:MAG TPA: hypothetical protein VMV46_06030 [Thermoanaerobaculia bacterium]|nr:hypothetical protein [Thermoanaerobaculia bacterium]